jgi:hypothetical protein
MLEHKVQGRFFELKKNARIMVNRLFDLSDLLLTHPLSKNQ